MQFYNKSAFIQRQQFTKAYKIDISSIQRAHDILHVYQWLTLFLGGFKN